MKRTGLHIKKRDKLMLLAGLTFGLGVFTYLAAGPVVCGPYAVLIGLIYAQTSKKR